MAAWPALAAKPTAKSTAATATCKPVATAVHTVARIVDARSLIVDGNQEIVLAGLLVPNATDGASRPEANWPLEVAARSALAAMTAGRTIGVAFPSKYSDRYGRRQAHIFTRQMSRISWLQAELIRRGLARVDLANLTAECAAPLLKLEDAARKTGAGLWADAAYRVRDAADARSLLRYQSTYQIIEGRIEGATRRRTLVYINFSREWRRDFTVGIGNRLWRQLEAKGIALNALAGKRVRVRGWIERRGGPFVYLRSPLEFEIVPHPQGPGGNDGLSPPNPAPSADDGPAHRHPALPTPTPIPMPTPSPPGDMPLPNDKRPTDKPPGVLEL